MILGLPPRPFGPWGRAVSQLAGLLGPARALPAGSGLRPLLSIPQPARCARLGTQRGRLIFGKPIIGIHVFYGIGGGI